MFDSLARHEGGGSTLIVFDAYLDGKSNITLAMSPTGIHKAGADVLDAAGMTRRQDLLDVWETPEKGPSTSFHTISESHMRAAVTSFARSETWPEVHHVQGDIQMCDHSRSNAEAAEKAAWDFLRLIDPLWAYVLIIRRGPGPIPTPVVRKEYRRGQAVLRVSYQPVQPAEYVG